MHMNEVTDEVVTALLGYQHPVMSASGIGTHYEIIANESSQHAVTVTSGPSFHLVATKLSWNDAMNLVRDEIANEIAENDDRPSLDVNPMPESLVELVNAEPQRAAAAKLAFRSAR